MWRLILILSATAALAQEPTFTTDARVVTLLATVRDAGGTLLPNLDKDDFLLDDGGKPAEIRYFSRETDLPLSIGLLIDTSASQFHVLERERRGAWAFLERVLRPGRDRAFVMKFDVGVKVLCPPTADLRSLQKRLSDADLPLRRRARHTDEPRPGDIAIGTKLRDAVRVASLKTMQKERARKALILFTDGVDSGSKTRLSDAMTAAQRTGNIVYSILYADPNGYGKTGRDPQTGLPVQVAVKGRRILSNLARSSGGGMFIVTANLTLESILAEIEAQLRTQYSIGFVPAETKPGEYRKIAVTTRRDGTAVQPREGYYAP